MRTSALLPLVAVVSCASAYKAELETICNVTSLAGTHSMAVGSEERMKKEAEYLASHLKSGDVQRLFNRLASVDPAQRGEALRAEASRYGLSKCAFADSMNEEAKQQLK